jgi:hypothetical protein
MKELKFLSLVMVAGAAALLTACTSESENGPSNNISYESIKAAQPVPVTFGTYIGEQAITRAGTTGTMDDSRLQSSGFGVFGYYTNNGNYVSTASSGSKPNFMYNQQVTYSGSWTYTPIKYWPNEYGNSAVSTAEDKLSFFAYAPYVPLEAFTPSSSEGDSDGFKPTDSAPGIASKGIVRVSGNNYGGDPIVTYAFDSNPSRSVDLMYAVSAAAITDGPAVNNTPSAPNAIVAGAPLVNITKQSTGGKIKFDFKHSLARLELEVIGAFDVTSSSPTYGDLDANSKITVESVVIKGDWTASDRLNLHTGAWENQSAVSTNQTITISSANCLNPNILDNNPSTYASITIPGVEGNGKAKQVMTDGSGNTQYLMFIPDTNTRITEVTITYFVNTQDGNLYGGMSRVQNVITQTLAAPVNLSAGNAYKLVLTLGMTTVKIDAQVSPWVTTGNESEVWLPINN